MVLALTDVEKIAHLACLSVPDDILAMATDLSNILELVVKMDAVDTENVMPMAHPLDMKQRLRPDQVTETDQREAFQSTAPATDNGLYLVPKVLE